jgi:HEAT repeat protein
MRPLTPAILRLIVEALTDPEPLVAQTAGGALYAAGDDALPGMIELMASEDAGTRRRAAGAADLLGVKPAQILPALEKLRQDPDESVRSAAAEAIGKIKPE